MHYLVSFFNAPKILFPSHDSEQVFPWWRTESGNNHSGNPTGRRKSLLSLHRLRRHIVVPETKYLLLLKKGEVIDRDVGKAACRDVLSGYRSKCSLSKKTSSIIKQKVTFLSRCTQRLLIASLKVKNSAKRIMPWPPVDLSFQSALAHHKDHPQALCCTPGEFPLSLQVCCGQNWVPPPQKRVFPVGICVGASLPTRIAERFVNSRTCNSYILIAFNYARLDQISLRALVHHFRH